VQDLAGDEPVKIPSEVMLRPGSITIPGNLTGELCPRLNDFDLSEPGIVLALQ
jgi:hypothetical protein